MKPKGVVVIGGHINGLGIIRAFAASGIPAGVILTKPYDIAHYSRHASGYETAFKMAEQPDELEEALKRRSAQWKGWALFPSNDEALAALARNRQRLESEYLVLAPPAELIPYFLDKERMLNVAQSIGIQVPVCYGPAVPDTAARPDIRYPVIVKPTVGHRFADRFGRKVFVAGNRAELAEAVSRAGRAGTPCRIFDVVPGADNRVYCYCVYMNANGIPRAECTIRKLRQSPAFFGVSRVAEISAHIPEVREGIIAFLRKIGHRGIAVAEYKHDPRDNTFRFLEVNGRSVIYNSLLRRSGMDLARLAWSDQVEGRTDAVAVGHWPGVWINLHADLLHSALKGRREGLRLKDFAGPYLRPKMEAVWSASDPKPFVAEWGKTLAMACRAVLP